MGVPLFFSNKSFLMSFKCLVKVTLETFSFSKSSSKLVNLFLKLSPANFASFAKGPAVALIVQDSLPRDFRERMVK